MTPDAAGLSSSLIYMMVATELLLVAGGAYMYFRWQRARRQCDELLKEKEVIFGFVHDVGEVFAEAEDIDADLLLKRVLFYALRTTKATAGAIYLQEEGNDLLHARALSGVFPPLVDAVDGRTDPGLSRARHVETLVRTRAIAKGEGLVGMVADTASALLVPDAEHDPRVPQHALDFLKIHSLLLVPMRFHQKVLGVLVVVNRSDGSSFDETDENLLQALADQASASVHYVGLRGALDEKQRIDHDLGWPAAFRPHCCPTSCLIRRGWNWPPLMSRPSRLAGITTTWWLLTSSIWASRWRMFPARALAAPC